MARLIDANALKVKAFADPDSGEGIVYVQDIDEAPTVDAVEVVRCWKCRFCKEHPTSDKVKMCTNENWNTEYYPLVHDNDFCSYGERRTDG